MQIDTSNIAPRVFFVISVMMLAGCASQTGVEVISHRNVPYPLELSTTAIRGDSVVRAEWLTRAMFRDPLAGGEQGPNLVVEATLYGKDLIAAEIADTCEVDTVSDTPCYTAAWKNYENEHRPDSLLRIQLRMRSTFSLNSLDTKFWDIYLRGEDGIMHEPIRIESHEPVVVRRDSLPEPGRAPVRAGLYTRVVDLYFPIRTPFGAVTLAPDVPRVVLIMSGNRVELARFIWRIGSDDGAQVFRRRRDSASF